MREPVASFRHSHLLLSILLATGALVITGAARALAPSEVLNGFTIAGREAAMAGEDQSALTAAPEWAAFQEATRQSWRVVWNEATSLP
ncbi:MAG: hypothetical protein LUO93_02495, partial [Methanomicrobiales archaeon]|nr:hypothetical protein [Methanomicrobiales archaeon]